jgi:hypothetical protein
MAEQPKRGEQPQPPPKRDQPERPPSRSNLERRLERQTFNAGERDQADDQDPRSDELSRDVELGEGPAGENPRSPGNES